MSLLLLVTLLTRLVLVTTLIMYFSPTLKQYCNIYSSFSLVHGEHLIQFFNTETSGCATNELAVLKNSLLYQFCTLFSSLYSPNITHSSFKLSCRKWKCIFKHYKSLVSE